MDTATEVKQDTDHIARNLQEIIAEVENAVVDLRQHGDKLFGGNTLSGDDKTRPSHDGMPVINLLDVLEKTVGNLRAQVNRF